MRAVFVTVSAALAVGVAVYLLSRPDSDAPPEQPRAASLAPPAPAATGGAAPRSPARAVPDAGSSTSYYDQFRSASDLWAFASAMHRMALEGDDAAQFWLFRALWQCGAFYDEAFDAGPDAPGRPPLTLDEAMQRERKTPRIGATNVERLSARCARLRTPAAAEFGRAEDWLEKASGTGYPQAQIWMAGKLLRESGADLSIGAAARARALAYAALRSADADVILQTESVAMRFAHGESARERHEWVWTIAGCLRGASCGPDAEWLAPLCADEKRCQPQEGGLDIVRRLTGAQYAELEEEARELNRKIDAGQWDQLGF